MAISIHEVKNFNVVKLEGHLITGESVIALRTRIHELLEGDAKNLAIDLADVEYLDSSETIGARTTRLLS